jgi:putative restriction endonuclease
MVAEAEWLRATDDLVRTARSSRAVHRPVLLLYLLGRVQRGEPREVEFLEIERGIKEALASLGNAKKPEPMLPFWHLQSSPFWEVLGGEAVPSRESTAKPTRKALLEAKGALRPDWWNALIGNDELIAKLGERVLEQTWPTNEARVEAARLTGFKRA